LVWFRNAAKHFRKIGKLEKETVCFLGLKLVILLGVARNPINGQVYASREWLSGSMYIHTFYNTSSLTSSSGKI
jgi:hypothetical protein